MFRRLVVVGSTGTIGSRIAGRSRALVPTLETSSRGARPLRLDLREPERFDYSCLGAGDVVALCGGISAPDACAEEPERARAINVEGSIGFIERALGRDARVIFLSSDTVYGEREVEVDESCPCAPEGPYAAMKRAVEERFERDGRVRALRLSYVFAADDKFTQYLRDCASRGTEAAIFHPLYRAVVHVDDVAEATLALAQRWDEFPGFAVNVGGPEVLSRADCAGLLRELALERLRFRTVEPEPQFFHNRPRMIRMKSPHLSPLLGRAPRTLREAIALEFGRA